MKYVDGFVLVVKKKNLKDYIKIAKDAGKLWKKHGALEYFETVGDDLNPDMGKYRILLFPKIMEAKSDETIVFSFIVFKSKEHRNNVNKKVMSDPSMDKPKYKNKPMPFDFKKMAYGGFNVIVE